MQIIQEGWSFKLRGLNTAKITKSDIIEAVLMQLAELLKIEHEESDIFVRAARPTFRDSEGCKFVNAGIVTKKTSIFIDINPECGSLEARVYSDDLHMESHAKISSVLGRAFL
jgi:hypothetical protein